MFNRHTVSPLSGGIAACMLALIYAIIFANPRTSDTPAPASVDVQSLLSQQQPTKVFNTTQLAHINFTDHNGADFQFNQQKADATLLNFMFTACGNECPRQTAQLKQILHQLELDGTAENIQFVSVTIAPEADDTRALKYFTDRFDLDYSNWRFIRASRKQTDELLSTLQVVRNLSIENRLDHRNTLYLLNSKGDLAQQYQADPINTERVTREITQLAGLATTSL